jgi:hypothetical protein
MRPNIIPAPADAVEQSDHLSLLTRLARTLLLSQLSKIRFGRLRLIDGTEEHVFGRLSSEVPLDATIRVRAPALLGLRQFNLVGALDGGQPRFDE